MNLANLAEFELRVRHQHDDGSWGTLEPEARPHDAAAHDPEREWPNGTIYKCTSCDERVVVSNVVDSEELRP